MGRSFVRYAAALLVALATVTVSGQQAGDSCGLVYDVTVADLRHYSDAEIVQMTPATVTRIVDGDTLWIRFPCPPPGPDAEEKVRLMGLDTPEIGQPGADEATRFVRRSIGDATVYLAFDFRRRDRFDRLLAYVYLADGTLLNARLIACGLARPYREDRNHFSDLFERLAAGPRPDDCPTTTRTAPSDTPASPSPGTAAVAIETIANRSRHEHVLLRNNTSEAVDVSGWRIRDDDDTRLRIPPTEPLPPNGMLAICSGSGCVGNPVPSIRLTPKNVWGNGGDAAVLCDAGGAEVDRYCYEDGCSSPKPAPRCA